MERLQKIIANSGVCSRRKAEELIKQGKVKVDGEIVKVLGTTVSDKNVIEVNNVRINREEKVYYLLNKPRGVVTTTSDDKNRKTVIDLIETDKRIYPVGRLDYDTTGVLILTNDGEFANMIMHPSNNIEKVYVAKVKGIVTGEALNKLKSGVMIDNYLVAANRVKMRKVDQKNESCIVEITIHEGKNHQVKKMFEAVGYLVDKLKRERVAFLSTDGLLSGEYRKLSNKEVSQLYVYANKK